MWINENFCGLFWVSELIEASNLLTLSREKLATDCIQQGLVYIMRCI